MTQQAPGIITAYKADIKERNYGLDIARSCAVGLVFLSHSLLNLVSSKIPYLWYGVFIGVELFFSLSGFLIGRILLDLFDRHQEPLTFQHIGEFWKRRWFRTLPLYFILLGIYLLIYNVWINPVPFDWRYLFFLQNLTTTPRGFYGESWSLAIEEWFYLGMPLLLYLVYFLKKAITRSGSIDALFVPLVLLVIGVQAVIRYFHPACNDWGCIAVAYHFEAPAYGMIAAYIARRMSSARFRYAGLVLMAGILLCLTAAFIKVRLGDGPLAQLYFPVNGGGTAMIVFGLYYCRFAKQDSIIPFVSKISYSIYLIHLSGVIIPLLKIAKGTAWVGSWALWFICLVLTIGFSVLSYRIFELPFLRIRDRV